MSNLTHTLNRPRLVAVLAIAVSVVAVGTIAPAWAGTYTVTGTCSAWTPFNTNAARVAVFSNCPSLNARNSLGDFSSPNGAAGGWVFQAPAGTTLQAGTLSGNLSGGPSWRSRLYSENASRNYSYVLQDCQASCPDSLRGYQTPEGAQVRLVLIVKCVDSGGCPNSGSSPRGIFELLKSSVVVADPSAPAAAIAGGSVTDGGWHGGQQTVSVNAGDNTGIRVVRALVDGDARFSTPNALPCDYSHPLPCSNRDGVAVALNLSGLPDGEHALAAQAEDASGNPGTSPGQTINVDNTPPLAPTVPQLAGGPGFRKRNTFALSWSNPPQQFAPIAGARYRLCPQGQPLSSNACKETSVAAAEINRLAFQLPGPGAWTLRLWLYDAAGNASIEQGITVDGLGLISTAGKRSHLTAGRPRGRHRLMRRPRVQLGHSVKIAGRLTAGPRRRGVARRRLLVYQRVSVQGAQYRRVADVLTDKRGRYAYRAVAGPSRTVRLVFPGGPRIHGQIADVDVRVRAKLGIRADRRAVRNGESVTLFGRLRGGRVPPGGALIELQVRVRGKWRPFATPRTDPKGHWAYQYRFATVQEGTARFRFRSVLRKQPTYPYTAASKALSIRVNGL